MAELDLDKLFPARLTLLQAVADAGGMCLVVDDGYRCTLPIHHQGKHMAHSSLAQIVHSWEDK